MTTSSSTQALDPKALEGCPLCGDSVDMVVTPWRGMSSNLAPKITCPSCGLELWGIPVQGVNITGQIERSQDALVAAWNHRAALPTDAPEPVAFIVHDDPELGDYLTKSRQAADASGKRVTPLYSAT